MKAELLSDIVEWTGEVSSIGYWSFNPETGHVSWSDQTFRILGYNPGAVEPSYKLFRNAVDPGERKALDAEVKKALTQKNAYIVERAITIPNGRTKRVRAMAKRRANIAGQPELLVGMIQDIGHEHARQKSLGTALRWLETASEIARLGYWYLDIAHQSLEWSDEVYRIHGYEPGSFTPVVEEAINAYHPEDRQRIADAVRRGQEAGEPWSVHARLVRQNGDVRQVMASGKPLYDQGRLVALFGIIQDVTANEEREANDRLFVSLVKQTPEGICITDAQGRCEWVNEAFERLSGFTLEEIHGQKPGLKLQGPETNLETAVEIGEALKKGDSCSVEILNYRKDGQPYWNRLSIFPHFDINGKLTHFMSIQMDITAQKLAKEQLAEQSRTLEQSNFQLERERQSMESMAKKDRAMREELETAVARSRELQDELRRMAHYDELTGLPNRRFVLQRADAEHRRASRYGRPMSLIMADIDSFKAINDHFGHQVGDRAIAHVAALLDQALRTGIDICGRLGGEEFILVLPETNLAAAIQVAERLRTLLENTPFEEHPPILCSFGVAEATRHETLEDAIRVVDQNLYAAKEAGRNRVNY